MGGSRRLGRRQRSSVRRVHRAVQQRGRRDLCSGCLMSPTVMVTSAHCFIRGPGHRSRCRSPRTRPPQAAFTATGTVTNDPEFCLGCGNGLPGADTHDIAVVTLDQPQSPPVRGATRSAVARPPSVNTSIDVVGYGVTAFDGKTATGFGTRQIATTKVNGNGAHQRGVPQAAGLTGGMLRRLGRPGPDPRHATSRSRSSRSRAAIAGATA